MPRIKWTPDKVEWLRGFVPGHSIHEIRAGFEAEYGFLPTVSQIKNAKRSFNTKSGTTGGRFEKGNTPHNKGKTWDEFMSEEGKQRSLATCYKKGSMPHNAKQVGDERVDTDGYTFVKVVDRPSRQDCNDNWVSKQRLIWEKEHGPIPPGCMVIFLDGDRTNFSPDNLAIETQAEHAVIARWGIPYCDAESHEVARAIAAMKTAKYAAVRRAKEGR